MVLSALAGKVRTADGFSSAAATFSTRRVPDGRAPFMAASDGDGEGAEDDSSGIGDGDLDSPSVVLDDLTWRVEKLRLEEANTKRFLKAGPRFLPYEECRKWVQAWNRWDTEEDWKTWIMEGEKRNSYIPARPDEYYGRLGQWRSWSHFFGKEEDDDGDGAEIVARCK